RLLPLPPLHQKHRPFAPIAHRPCPPPASDARAQGPQGRLARLEEGRRLATRLLLHRPARGLARSPQGARRPPGRHARARPAHLPGPHARSRQEGRRYRDRPPRQPGHAPEPGHDPAKARKGLPGVARRPAVLAARKDPAPALAPVGLARHHLVPGRVVAANRSSIASASPISVADSWTDSNPAIIKVGRMNLWDHNAKTTRTSKHNPSWKRVSCILKDNGDVFIYAEADASLVHHIHLTHCTRTDIQLLDPSLLLHTFAFAIYPSVASPEDKPQLPIYLSVDNRPLLEVWFVLLRCYTTPELYGPPNGDWVDGFRISRTLYFRIVDGRHIGKNTWSVENEERAIDSYCEVLLDGGVRSRTCVKKGTSKPFWREDYLFSDLPPLHSNLLVVIRSCNKRGKDVAIGQVDLNLSELKRDETFEGWHPVRYHREGVQEHAGDLCLKIRIEEQAVLMSSEYEPLREMLQNFEQHLTPSLPKIITDLERLADILLRIYQASNIAIDWLMYLAEVEILGLERNDRPILNSLIVEPSVSNEKATKAAQMDANILFRGNSLLTKAVDSHMKRAGADYLEETLGDILRSIAEENVICEVDPMRLCIPEDLKQNWRILMALTRQVWQAIKDSVQRCPVELRKIFGHIRAQVEERYGAMLLTVRYTSVSGFLFLRFFCPAVLNPKLFGLMREHPDSRAQRTLTLVAKSLQGLANMSRFGVKEPWMAPMNEFLDESMRDFRKFIDGVCTPPTVLFVTNPAQPIYLAPAQIKARLPQPSREGIPTLPYLIDQPRDCAALVSFWLKWYTEQSMTSKPKLDGPLLKFHRLCCNLDKRTRALVESAETAAEKSSVGSFPAYPPTSLPWDNQQQPKNHDPGSLPPPSLSSRPGTADTTLTNPPSTEKPPIEDPVESIPLTVQSTSSSCSTTAPLPAILPPSTSTVVKKSKPGSSLSHVLGGFRLTKSKHT
ncbi:Inhibitory regulator protein BUD2/CLA2, partial [Neolecta irregularis DAH-3]